jgi:hypothetical protein
MSGAYAANAIGISDQVPAKVVVVCSTRRAAIGNWRLMLLIRKRYGFITPAVLNPPPLAAGCCRV